MPRYTSRYSGIQIDAGIEKSHKTGSNDPTVNTVGVLGQRYFNTVSEATFECVSIVTVDDVTTFVWMPLNRYFINTSASDSYAITIPGITDYTQLIGVSILVKMTVANTSACSLNVNSLGAKNICRGVNTAMVTGDIIANMIVELVYDGTQFQLKSQGADVYGLINDHKGEVVSQLITATRDVSTTGVQTITGLTRTPKRIEVRAVIVSITAPTLSIGAWEANGPAQSCAAIYPNSTSHACTYSNSAAILIGTGANVYATGTIQNVTDSQFEINWAKTGLPTGTVTLQFIVHYH